MIREPLPPERRRVIRAWAIRRHIALGEAFDEPSAFVLGIPVRRRYRAVDGHTLLMGLPAYHGDLRPSFDDGSDWSLEDRELLQRLSDAEGVA